MNKISFRLVHQISSVLVDQPMPYIPQSNTQVFTFPEGELHSIATRFPLPARALAYSSSGLHLFASGDDAGTKVIDLAENKVFRTLRSTEYTSGVATDPEADYVASMAADGTLTIWNIATGNQEFVKKKLASKIKPASTARLIPAWHPDGGNVLAAPADDGMIKLYERLSWESAGELVGDHTSAVRLLAFSKNGLYLACSCEDNSVVIWDVNQRVVIDKKTLLGSVCGLAWHPTTNQLVATTEDGQLAVWNDTIPSSMPGPTEDIDALNGIRKKGSDEDLHADKKKSSKKSSAGGGYLDDEALSDSDDNDDDEGNGSDLLGSFIEDDLDEGNGPGAAQGHSNKNMRRRVGRRGGGKRPPSWMDHGYPTLDSAMEDLLPRPQPAIQPGSTRTDAGRRYLAYTSLGSIVSRRESDHHVVEVSFHDTAKVRRRVPLLSDFYGFTMASLGEHGVLYASPSSGDASSTAVYRPFESWASNADWTVSLPAGEEAECVAAGTTFCAVATSERYLRIFTSGGVQKGLISLPGAPVALATHGSYLAVSHHAGAPTSAGDQCISVTVLDLLSERPVFERAPLALSPGSTLTWMGFSEEGMLATYDSEGVLRVRSPEYGGSWLPVFVAAAERKGAEHFWVFSLSMRSKEVQCIVCAHSPEPIVPSGSARPVVTAAPMKVPVVRYDDGIAALESEVLRNKAAMSHVKEMIASIGGPQEEDHELMEEVLALSSTARAAQVESDRAALRLFTRFAQTDRMVKALEVADGMSTVMGLQGALKIANHQRLGALAQQIEAIIDHRNGITAEEAEEEHYKQGNFVDSTAAGGAAGGAMGVNKVGSAIKGGLLNEEIENEKPNGAGKVEKKDDVKRKNSTSAGNPFARKKSKV